ncbi:MAG: GNAT family N-acetyltransferase [Caldilinea sp.]|nr:GNAT family N-acetyltransferase [Caldilinea sp.]MDW8440623.1 GNAT family N-acetyltransferase [Caldilineaceae bacterium]
MSPQPCLTVRSVVAADVDTVAHLHVAIWRAAYRGLLPDAFLDALSVESRATMWRHMVEQGASPALVAEQAGEIVGFLLGGPAQDADAQPGVTAEIYAIYVSPDFWGRGVGARLLQEGLAILRDQGYREATLWVLRNNVRARRFYEAMGFRVDGGEKVEEHSGVAFDEIRYRAPIA